jgi:hypothetical protein
MTCEYDAPGGELFEHHDAIRRSSRANTTRADAKSSLGNFGTATLIGKSAVRRSSSGHGRALGTESIRNALRSGAERSHVVGSRSPEAGLDQTSAAHKLAGQLNK